MVGSTDDGAGGLPPPPPPLATPEAALPDLAGDLDRMMSGVEAAVGEYRSGAITLQDLQHRCLEAGVVRSGGALLIWDWVNGKVFGYDGFQVTEIPLGQS